jgi:hypothetical protein
MAARAVNGRFETFLRRRPGFKRAVRALYYGLNEAHDERPFLHPDTYAQLNARYRPYNERLATFLQTNGYPVGGWLSRTG